VGHFYLGCVFLKKFICCALALQAFAEIIRKAFRKNYRTQEIDFQVGKVPVSLQNPVLLEVLDRQHAACAKKHKAATEGSLSLVPRPKSRQPPGQRVPWAGGDLSSDSSESHTDVARGDELRRAPGLVDSSGCLHADNRRHRHYRGG
jgi:hypothetical protein